MTIFEGTAGERFVPRARDAIRIEACWAAKTRAALLYAENLTPNFFDLSSGEAGEILDKVRQYRIRLAIVCLPGTVGFSSRFRGRSSRRLADCATSFMITSVIRCRHRRG